ncbi:nucleotide-sugar epimerase [Baekduia alba]|uniref:SDR family oxidoreductase n=1 Tax=Baekduia alba TaxID=2997333 RepID=UPI002341DE6A|nr:SDR family oxidoreductase [Baekduia alba]WCB96303.1 nucleotide-sugar epimerase [Baekduia alba]
MSRLLLTGATGFLGGELLVRLIERTDRDIVALIRADDADAAQARLDATLATLLPPEAIVPGRVRAVAAHLDQPGLGLDEPALDALAAEIDTVVHCAASVQFTLPYDEAYAINVGGTRAMLDLAARAPGLERFVHVSTAYVAGDRPGPYCESEGDVGQRPRNTYEQTKLIAERHVLDAGLPCTSILRPSIVVGDSRTGWTPAFNVIYWPLRAFARGLFPVVPADADARVDIVPVDTVADALLTLADGPERSGTFHVVAGDDAPTARRLTELAARAFGAALPDFVAPGTAPEVEQRAGAFLPYFRVPGVFRTDAASRMGFVAPPLESYFANLLRYADEARWGKACRRRWDVGELAAAVQPAA